MWHENSFGALGTPLCMGSVWASPIVMNLSIIDPVQTAAPGSVVTYHFGLMNTIGTNLPIFGFVNLDAPAYLSRSSIRSRFQEMEQ